MNRITETVIEADPTLPVIRMTRDFVATPEQLFRAHTDPVLFAQWVGPDAMATRIEHWDASTGGSWRYVSVRDGTEYAFRGCFPRAREAQSKGVRKVRQQDKQNPRKRRRAFTSSPSIDFWIWPFTRPVPGHAQTPWRNWPREKAIYPCQCL